MISASHDSTAKQLRWGILGAAEIARKNWKAIWNSKNGRIAGLASRDVARGQRFIEQCQKEAPFESVPRIFDNYEALLASTDIDAVYVPLPTAVRQTWIRAAVKAGKHVVCEKPCATSVSELEETLELCRRHQVQFADGVMFVHSQRLERILRSLNQDKTAGVIRRISSAFTFNEEEESFASNIRSRSELEPDGCLGDLGWYCIRFALSILGGRLPERVTGRTLRQYHHKDSALPVPSEFSGELFFADAVSATFYCSFVTELQQWAIVSGTKGHLRVDDFVLPFSANQLQFQTASPLFQVNGCNFEMKPEARLWTVEEPSHGEFSAQETNLFRRFAEQAMSGRLNPVWPEMALKTQRIMEACALSSRTGSREVSLRS